MGIPVKLEIFEGPLDVLLSLIDRNKINIYDIPIVEITDQYLEYIRGMEFPDMNVMSEFLVMAATLIDIKCRMLLPGKPQEEEEEEDPRTELVQRLLEHKLYKYMSTELKSCQEEANKSLFRDKHLPEEVESYRPPLDYGDLLGDMTLDKLRRIFNDVMKRKEDKVDPIRSQYGNIRRDEVDMEAKARSVEEYVRTHETFYFQALLEESASKMEVIVTFLVVLEMMKTGRVTLEQENIFGDILITSQPGEEDGFMWEGDAENDYL